MISMTGFGSGKADRNGRTLSLTVSTVNRKQLDIRVNLPAELLHMEPSVRSDVRQALSRGMVQISAEFDDQKAPTQAGLNVPLAKSVWQQLKELRTELGISGDPEFSDLLAVPDLFVTGAQGLSAEEMEAMLQEAFKQGMAALLAFRKTEGDALNKDLNARKEILVKLVDGIAERAPGVPAAYREKLLGRIKELDPAVEIDEERLMKEVLLYADKADITEEITRLGSHLGQMTQLFDAGDTAVGRKLDFLIQEMGREINTIGSKCSDKDIALHVVDFKTELERIREQIQNIE